MNPAVEIDWASFRSGHFEGLENNAWSENVQNVSNAPNVLHKLSRNGFFLDKCPQGARCRVEPFLTVEDYVQHRQLHHTQALNLFWWDLSPHSQDYRRIGASLDQYLLSRIYKDLPGHSSTDLDHLNETFSSFSVAYQSVIPLYCADLLLLFDPERCKHCSIFTVKAIVAREATFLEAKVAFESLVSAAGRILGTEPQNYPSWRQNACVRKQDSKKVVSTILQQLRHRILASMDKRRIAQWSPVIALFPILERQSFTLGKRKQSLEDRTEDTPFPLGTDVYSPPRTSLTQHWIRRGT